MAIFVLKELSNIQIQIRYTPPTGDNNSYYLKQTESQFSVVQIKTSIGGHPVFIINSCNNDMATY